MSHSSALPLPQYPPNAQQQRSLMMRNYRYTLDVVQQPVRARMCGFGDKDRRPITPPPCVRLNIIDPDTGQPVTHITDVDCNFFILSVDLWDAEGGHEQNLVMHPSNSTSSALGGSNGNSPTSPSVYQQSWTTPPIDNGQYSYQSEYPHNPSYIPPPHNSAQGYQSTYPPYPSGSGPMHPAYAPEDPYGMQHSQGGGSFTRNLIGSLTASAFRLKDDKDVPGIWFILQDLSVRTEGTFRLKFSFLNLGMTPETGSPRAPGLALNTGKSKVITTAMSEPFLVYSAKKFPGMIESTELSRKFASQGIRIPVRHANEKKTDDEED